MQRRQCEQSSYKTNLNINTNALSKFDLRIPAMKCTMDFARNSNIDLDNAKSQPKHVNMFSEALTSTKDERKRKDLRARIRKLFDFNQM